jgi:ABC-type lipoprotein release transport system permease subunit
MPAQSNIGFAYARRRRQRRSVMFAQLIATVAFMVSIAVVVTAVSIGISHAGAFAG